MKTKVLKSILPAFAILLAIGFAFATEAEPVSQTAYYEHPVSGVQSVTIGNECQDQSGIDCKFNGYQLYADMDTTIPLRKPNQ